MKKIVVPFLRTPYNYDTDQVSQDTGLECLDKSLAQQHLAEEMDINNIVARFTRTGTLPQHQMPPLQEDFTKGIRSYQDALDLMVRAREAFMDQPANVRNRFQNDPARFIDFCSDEANMPEMKKMGLLSPEKVQELTRQEQDREAMVALGKAAKAAKEAEKSLQGDTKKGVT